MTVDSQRLYRERFPERDREQKTRIWKVLCQDFFQRYIRPGSSVVDIGAGYCDFINHIQAAEKIALDVNPDTRLHALDTVRVCGDSVFDMHSIPDGSVDACFLSNFLEHMLSKDDVLKVLCECERILSANGRILILQPNIKYVGGAYWDFFDHHIPLTEASLEEALALAGFSVSTCIPRFLPYTTRSSLPQHPLLVRLYLMVPWAWRFLGQQTFIVAEPTRD